MTSTASYQIYRAQQLGVGRKELEKELQRLLKVSEGELKQLLTQSAEVGYRFDLDRIGTEAVPFEENALLQSIVSASIDDVTGGFKNLTQTLGMVDPYGKALPLQDVCCLECKDGKVSTPYDPKISHFFCCDKCDFMININ